MAKCLRVLQQLVFVCGDGGAAARQAVGTSVAGSETERLL